jgi:excisionase family DNA binding protein
MNQNPNKDGKEPGADGGMLTKLQVAKFLQVNTNKVGNLMKRRILPYYKLGRAVRFKLSDVQKRLDETCRIAGPVRR